MKSPSLFLPPRTPARRTAFAAVAVACLFLAGLRALPAQTITPESVPAPEDTTVAPDATPAPDAAPSDGGTGRRSRRARPGPTPGPDIDPALIQKAQESPIDISAEGETTYGNTPDGRIATAIKNVNIVTNDASIFCDRAEYNLDTHVALLEGDVRIYRNDTVIMAERAVYNFTTKSIRGLDFHGSRPPYNFGSVGVFSPGQGTQYNLRNSTFSTDENSKEDFYLRSKRIRIYPDNRVIYIGSTLYVGTTPVFYFPYFFQSLDQQSGYQFTPGYSSTNGEYLLAGLTFPITEHLTGLIRGDYRSKRGVGGGLTFYYKPNKRKKQAPSGAGPITPYATDDDSGEASLVGDENPSPGNSAAPTDNTSAQNVLTNGNSSGDANPGGGVNGGYLPTGEALSHQIRNREGFTFLSFFLKDSETDLNRTALVRLPIDPDRYRISFKDTQFFTDDFFAKVDFERLSDRYLLQDFYEGEFTKNPNPDNVIFLTYHQPTWVSQIVARYQVNSFFDTTERLPELTFDMPRLRLFNTPLYYENSNSLGYLKRAYGDLNPVPDYDTFRADTFHQLTLPETLFGWLNVVPKVGARATYYSHTAPANSSANDLQLTDTDVTDASLLTLPPQDLDPLSAKRAQELRNTIGAFQPQGDLIRPVLNAGVEASFKLSRQYDDVETRAFGLDALQHVIQPYADFEEVEDFGYGSRKLLQFDRLLPTTQLQPIDFPQFNSIDSIDEQTAVRLGVRNRLQTKRDALTFDWLELDTFFQVNIYEPRNNSAFVNDNTTLSNLFNQFTFRPLPWINLTVDSQLPVFNGHKGFTEINSSLDTQITSNLDVTISHLYLDNNPFFANSSLLRANVYYRFDDNWSAGFSERYEFAQHQLQAQSYTLYRDLSSFVASFGITVRNNAGIEDYGVVLNFTLKGVPRVNLPVGFDVNSVSNDLSGSQ